MLKGRAAGKVLRLGTMAQVQQRVRVASRRQLVYAVQVQGCMQEEEVRGLARLAADLCQGFEPVQEPGAGHVSPGYAVPGARKGLTLARGFGCINVTGQGFNPQVWSNPQESSLVFCVRMARSATLLKTQYGQVQMIQIQILPCCDNSSRH